MAARRIALIAGASGLTGHEVLKLLLADTRYRQVYALVRTRTLPSHSRLKEIVVDFANLPPLPPADDVYCCLGTTLRKAGSQAAFREVDRDYVVNLAAAAKRAGTRRFLVVSAIAASPTSAVFYSRVKGEMEAAVEDASYDQLHVLQPSFLLGNRRESRVGEKFAIAATSIIAPLMRGPASKYRPIDAGTLARAMIQAAWTRSSGTTRYQSNEIAALGNSA
ncbi:MAG: NAD(P)H-binding protein [Betaproteobacteria bacterium]